MVRKIKYLCRNRNCGISIGKVFDIITSTLDRRSYSADMIYMPMKGVSPISIIRNLLYTLLHRDSRSIFHITGDVHYLSYVLPKNRTITTVHDLVFLEHLKYGSVKRAILKLLYVNSLKRNRYVVCISNKTREEVINHLNIDVNKLKVIPDPISPDYIPTKKDFNTDFPTVLHIGTKSNKNLILLAKALNGLNINLRIIGKLNDSQIQILKANNIYYTTAYQISEQQLIREYQSCDIVSFISIYEGFGMPLIEAQAMGRVCISSAIEPMISISKGSCILVNPYDIQEIRAAYQRVINDPTYREDYIKKGLLNVQQYDSHKVVKQYEQLYESIDIL